MPYNQNRMGLGCIDVSRQNNAIIDHAIQEGIHFFDTSDCYGQDHESERALGDKLKNYDRARFVLCTKGGIQRSLKGFDLNGKPDYLMEACANSLSRLQTSYIDIYYLHRVDPNTAIEESMCALKKLVELGSIRQIGLSEVTADQIQRAHKIHPIGAVQIEYSPWSRQDERNGVIQTCKELGIDLIAYSPLGRGLFTQRDKVFFETLPEGNYLKLLPRYTDSLEHNLKARALLQNFADSHGMRLSQLVLAWSIQNGCIPIPATLNPQHLSENSAALQMNLTDSDMSDLNKILEQCEFSGLRYPSPEISGIFPEKPLSYRKLSVPGSHGIFTPLSDVNYQDNASNAFKSTPLG